MRDRWRGGIRLSVALISLAMGVPAIAGPPYLTDDPVPADAGHWEVYLYAEGDGRKSAFDGEAGLDVNYGAGRDLQLTATLPLSFSHEPGESWQSGSGDVEAGVKYRFLHLEAQGLSASIFPTVILPTAAHSPGEMTQFFLPLWVQKDLAGGTSVFGGGGYTINPGAGNRDFSEVGIAVTQDVSEKLSVGAELARQGPGTISGKAQTSVGVGTVVQLSDHYALLFSGGPTWADQQTSYHLYAALGLNF